MTGHEELQSLYEQKILHHNRSPYHCYSQEKSDRTAETNNPLCGDAVTVFLRLEDEHVAEASFVSEGCALCKASASMMIQAAEGRSAEEIRHLFEEFELLLQEGEVDEETAEDLGELLAFAGVREYPARLQCATLPWQAMEKALA